MCHHHRHGLVRIKIISVCLTSVLLLLLLVSVSEANPDAKRLYDDLLSHYNRLIRPVSNYSQVVTVRLGLHLTQLIDLVSCNWIPIIYSYLSTVCIQKRSLRVYFGYCNSNCNKG